MDFDFSTTTEIKVKMLECGSLTQKGLKTDVEALQNNTTNGIFKMKHPSLHSANLDTTCEKS